MIGSENFDWSNSAGWWRVLPYACYTGIVPVPSFIWYKYLYSSALTSWAFSKLISRCKYCLPSQSIGKPSGTQRRNKDFRRVPVKLSNTVTLRSEKEILYQNFSSFQHLENPNLISIFEHVCYSNNLTVEMFLIIIKSRQTVDVNLIVI